MSRYDIWNLGFADLLTRIRNAKLVGKTEVRVPSSKMKKVIAEQLVKNGYLADVKLEDAKPRGVTINEAAKAKRGGELLLKVY